MSVLPALRAQLAAHLAPARPAGPPWATGVAALDAALGGGLPRGRLTELVGPRAGGKTTLLQHVARRVLDAGGWVAWIDVQRTLAPEPWTTAGRRFVVVRPPDPRRLAWIADALLRSGVFSLVVLDGVPRLARTAGFRLAQLAREKDAACVVVHDGTAALRLTGALRLGVERRRRTAEPLPPSIAAAPRRGTRRERQLVVAAAGHAGSGHADADTFPPLAPTAPRDELLVTIDKGAPGQGTTAAARRPIALSAPLGFVARLTAHPLIADRRGAALATRRPWHPTPTAPDADGHDPAHPYAAAAAQRWGGLGASMADVHNRPSPPPTAPPRGHDGAALPSDRLGRPLHELGAWERSRYREWERRQARRDATDRPHHPSGDLPDRRTPDRLTRDWTAYKGRRRAAQPEYGRRSRRSEARLRTGAVLQDASWQRRIADDADTGG